MIIRKIYIENFGHFHDFTLELTPGLNRLREGNEFGKTTILEFVRRVLWGYPDGHAPKHINRYPARFAAGEYGGFLEVELADGSRAKFERYGVKGKLVVRRPDGSEEAGEEFLRRLSPVSGDCYRNVYAVTLDEITLLTSLDGDEIRGRLYGGAITGGEVSLPALGKYLDERAKELYKQRGPAHRIGEARQALRESCDRRDEAVNAAARRTGLEKEFADLEKEAAQLRAEAEAEAKSAAEAEILLKAHPHYRKLAETDAALAGIPAGQEVTEDAARRAEELAEQLKGREGSAVPAVDATQLSVLAAEIALLDRELAGSGSEPLPSEADLAAARELEKQSAAAAEVVAFPWWIWILATAAFGALAAAVAVDGLLLPGLAAAVVFALGAIWGMIAALRRREETCRSAAETEEKCAEFGRKLHLACPPEKFSAVLDARRRRRELADRLAELHAAQAEHDKFAALQRGLDELLHRFGCADAAEMRARAERTAKTAALKRARAEEEASLNALLPPEKRPDFAHFDADAVKARRDDSLRRRAEAEQGVSLLHQNAGAVANELKHLPGDGEIELLASEIESAKNELRRRVREFLVLRTARALLAAAVDRYERESQPEVFKRAEKLFSAFTGGRYPRLYKKVATGQLTVCDDQTGSEKTFPALSRGTREELMIAMRLALIECTERGAEALPVCFDDVGVNFDRERLARVEAAVAEFARGRQVIWLSHS
jgi:uncharacterized protein YhaN